MIILTRGLLAAAVTVPLLTAATPAGAEPAPARERVNLAVEQAIDALPTAAESRAGYKRSSFKHWIDADKDGCTTRQEVLIEEAIEEPVIGTGCSLTDGTWRSYYDGKTTDNPRSLDIDHMVPLAEAWDSGASQWSAKKRERYANDLGSPSSLVAVTARSNRQKADKDPAEWWVPAKDASCQYLADWVATKTRWKLAVDQTEKQALTSRAVECSGTRVAADIAH
ncbi:HNH endonuclease family protein [Streptomyces sp. 891-h]|uniref:HNH endonuclease family protein n=1 Tax=Streptomyces sp. 891-h TaxID=2720714 RepID=UPI001FAAE26C|nr:HNH endonuclease family protein [Streptomyces sp. 891-h]UNZ21378.1 HNH endonuclease [Streptomyces sp. 891-h]